MSNSYCLDELWQAIGLCEATHVFIESQFASKFEEVRKKMNARGGAKKNQVLLLSNYISEPVRYPSITGSAATIARLTGKDASNKSPNTKRRMTVPARTDSPRSVALVRKRFLQTTENC